MAILLKVFLRIRGDLCHSTQSSNVLTRYGDGTSDALHRTLLMDHPGATEQPLLEVPWILGCDTNTIRANSPSNPEWFDLTHSRYFPKFDVFRKHNEGFCIGGQTLRSFAPQIRQEECEYYNDPAMHAFGFTILEPKGSYNNRNRFSGLSSSSCSSRRCRGHFLMQVPGALEAMWS